jgi:drug/metabolite transporter (DMT)-like permease
MIDWMDLAVTWVAWGTSYLAVAVVVAPGGFAPMIAGAIRMAIAAVALLGIASMRGSIALPRGAWPSVAITGLLGWTVSLGLVFFAETRVSSGYAALVMSATPVLIVGFEAIRARALPSAGELAGLGTGTLGMALLAWPALDGTIDPLGAVALFAAAAATAASMLVHRHRVPHGAPLVTAGWEMAIAAFGFGALALVFGESLGAPRLEAWAALLYLAIAASAVAYASYIRLVERVAPSLVATHAYVNPVVAVALGSIVLGERPSLLTLAGAGLLVAGVALVLDAPLRTLDVLTARLKRAAARARSGSASRT